MKTLNGYRVLAFLILAAIGCACCEAELVPTIVHEFTAHDDANLDGAYPVDLIASGDRFYGLTYAGGESDAGLIFSINPDGSDFQVLHTFDLGENPSQNKPLILSGETLYGANEAEFVYAINVNGSDFHHIYEFTNSNGGFGPGCGLTLDGDTLFGTTTFGGTNGNGTIFAVTISGENSRVLYSFSGYDDPNVHSNTDGARPWAGLTLSNEVLYGGTQDGGQGSGTIFKINTDGTDFTVLHTFAARQSQLPGPNADGMSVVGKMIFHSSKLYGTTRWGGTSGAGVLFSLNLDGSDFKILYAFPGQPDFSGNDPGPLLLADQKLYGARPSGGTNEQGFIFEYDIGAATFKTLYSFSGQDDGNRPQSGLVLVGNKLYFTATSGGASGTGTVGFLQLDIPLTLDVLKTDQGIRILLHGELGLAYTLEETKTFPAAGWLHPQIVTVNQTPQPIDLPAPAVPTFWRARFP